MSADPYIVTTKREIPETPAGRSRLADHDRRAVAGLDEAREELHRRGLPSRHITRSGGKVGPLPDRTVIEVELTTWQVLWYVSDLDAEELAGALGGIEACQQRILDAYNDRQAVAA
jgi:hypothetical protein